MLFQSGSDPERLPSSGGGSHVGKKADPAAGSTDSKITAGGTSGLSGIESKIIIVITWNTWNLLLYLIIIIVVFACHYVIILALHI